MYFSHQFPIRTFPISTPTYYMTTPSNRSIFRVTGHLCGEFTGHRWIPRTKASDAEFWCFFIRAWTSGWVNNREASDLRRHCTYYDVIVMTNQLACTSVNVVYPPESSCPIYWTYILYSLLQFEHMWRINLLVIIYINTSTIDFYKFGIKSAGWFFLWHPVNPRWQPLCRSDSTRSDRGSVTRTNCRWKLSIPGNLSVCVL